MKLRLPSKLSSTTAVFSKVKTRKAFGVAKETIFEEEDEDTDLEDKYDDTQEQEEHTVEEDVSNDESATEEESRDDETRYDDGDSYAYTEYTRYYEDDDGETQFTRQSSTCTDDYSRYTTTIDKADDDDDRSLFSSDTDAGITLATIEERDFQRFVRRQDLIAASREETEVNSRSNEDSVDTSHTVPTALPSSRFCSNFFDLCGFLLGSEIVDDADPQITRKRQTNPESLLSENEDEDEDDESFSEEEDDEDEIQKQNDEETVLYIDERSNIAPTQVNPEENKIQSPQPEANVAPPSTKIVLQEDKKKPWRKFRPHMALLPKAKRPSVSDQGSPKIAEESESTPKCLVSKPEVEETEKGSQFKLNVLGKPPKLMHRLRNGGTVVNSAKGTENGSHDVGSEENTELSETLSETKPQRKPSKMVKRLKQAGTSSKSAIAAAAVGAGVAVAAAHRRVKTLKAERSTRHKVDVSIADDTPIAPSANVSSTAQPNNIPFTTSTLARGSSITKESFNQVIEEDASKIKTIKKVKVGTDEFGNDTFAYVVYVPDHCSSDDVNIEELVEKVPTSQLIRGKLDDSEMELTLARTQSAENMTEKIEEGDQYVLMEVDELPVNEVERLGKNETPMEALIKMPFSNEVDSRSGTKTESRPGPFTPTAALKPATDAMAAGAVAATSATLVATSSQCFNNNEAPEEAPEDNYKQNSILEALSFQSVVTDAQETVNALSSNVMAVVPLQKETSNESTTLSQQDELVLMEDEDEDEIEIELEEQEEDEDADDIISSIASDGAVIILESKATEDNSVQTTREALSPEGVPEKVGQRMRRIRSLKKLWRSTKKQF